MNSTNNTSTKFAIAALLVVASLASCEAGLVKMGFAKDKMPVEVESVLHTFHRARRLNFMEMRTLQTSEGVVVDEDHQHHENEQHAHDDEEEDFGHVDFEDAASHVEADDEGESHSEKVEEFVEIQEDFYSNATMDLLLNETSTDDDDEVLFFNVEDETQEEPVVAATEAEDLTNIADLTEPVAEFASETNAETPVEPVRDEIATVGRTSVATGPRGGTADLSPGIQPTELSFMIVMEDFRYSEGVNSMEDITIGTKFGFTGRIVTQAEELGVASGTCTVTSALNTDLSYCDIYHKIDTDNFGGFGSVVVAGTADQVGGRLLVTGTGGSLQSTKKGYAMVQFDPAGNPVIYVLLKLF